MTCSAYEGNYKKARMQAFARSAGKCQTCGIRSATEAHHWALVYPDGCDLTADDLTAMCSPCHTIITAIRKQRYRSSGRQLAQAVIRALGAETRMPWTQRRSVYRTKKR